MERNQFTFYRSYWEAIRGLPKKDRENALEAIISYALEEKKPDNLSPVANAVFLLVKPTLDKGRQRAINGRAGGEQNGSKE